MRRPSSSLWIVAVGFMIAACGDDKPSVAITEADPVVARRSVALDTSVLVDIDTTLADSLLADTVEVAPADSVAPPPSFDAFWSGFQAMIRTGNVDAVARHAQIGEDTIGLGDLDRAYVKAFTEPFKSAVLALSPRDFRRDETAREASVVVGYNAEGRVVPEDEAVRDEAIRLRFDVVEGRYRWVGFEADA